MNNTTTIKVPNKYQGMVHSLEMYQSDIREYTVTTVRGYCFEQGVHVSVNSTQAGVLEEIRSIEKCNCTSCMRDAEMSKSDGSVKYVEPIAVAKMGDKNDPNQALNYDHIPFTKNVLQHATVINTYYNRDSSRYKVLMYSSREGIMEVVRLREDGVIDHRYTSETIYASHVTTIYEVEEGYTLPSNVATKVENTEPAENKQEVSSTPAETEAEKATQKFIEENEINFWNVTDIRKLDLMLKHVIESGVKADILPNHGGDSIYNYSFKMNNRFKSVLGRCNFNKRLIELSTSYLEKGSLVHIVQTLMHEFCHHVTYHILRKGYNDGDAIFEALIKACNSKSTRTTKVDFSKHVYQAECGCIITRHVKRDYSNYTCGTHKGSKINYIGYLTAKEIEELKGNE